MLQLFLFLSLEWGWCGRAANLSFLPLKVKTFWDSVVWFHPGGDTSGRSHPGLRKNKVFLFTEGCLSFSIFFVLVYCVFRCNITPGWNLTGEFFFFSHTQRNQRPRGEIGQVDKLTFFICCLVKEKNILSKIFYTAFQKENTPQTGICTFYDENEKMLYT